MKMTLHVVPKFAPMTLEALFDLVRTALSPLMIVKVLAVEPLPPRPEPEEWR